MRYSRGIESFCERKCLNVNKAVNLFCADKNIINKDLHIQQNWTKFASFIDKAIKDGTIQGRDISLTDKDYWNEVRERSQTRNEEFKSLDKEQLKFVRYIKDNNGLMHSFFGKREINIPKKNISYQTKQIQEISRYEKLKELGLLEEFYKYRKEQL